MPSPRVGEGRDPIRRAPRVIKQTLIRRLRATRTAVVTGSSGLRRMTTGPRMSPELIFILTLGLRMAITAAFVVSASVITERSGPVIGALVATLPISAGPSYVFLALDHDAAFIAEGALASLPINAATMFLGPDLCRAGAAPQRADQLRRRGRGVDRARLDGADGALVARRRPRRQRDRVRDLPAAVAALPSRQDAADHAALVRHPAARLAGRDAGGDRRHAVGLGRPGDQRHDRAVSGGVHQHDADPASAHRRPADRGRDRQ